MSQIFDDLKRTDMLPAGYADTHFAFLNRSAQPFAGYVRSLLEDWVTRYPPVEHPDLRGRFRADFDAAFFELFLHELLLRLGHAVMVHPHTPADLHTQPDFFALGPEGSSSFIEARVVTDKSPEEITRERILNVLYDEINKARITDHFIMIREVQLSSSKQPSGRRFRSALNEWLKTIESDTSHSIGEASLDNHRTFCHEDESATIKICLVPVKPELRGEIRSRSIGALPVRTRWGSSAAAIRRALKRKATKFGQLGSPYVIGINSVSEWGTSNVDVMNALFGDEQIVVDVDASINRVVRNENGFWRGPSGPQNTRVSAVLVGTVSPYNISSTTLRLYQNPWASTPYVGPLLRLPKAIPDQDRLVFEDGESLADLFALPPGWPGDFVP